MLGMLGRKRWETQPCTKLHLIFTDVSFQSSPVIFQMRTERSREGK